jgi:hypothetical protein
MRGDMGDTMNEKDTKMLEQINQFLNAMSPPDPDGMFSVAKVDSSADPVELYRQGLAMGSGHIWYVCTEKVATAITGNGPRAKANAEFYAAAPVFIRWLLARLNVVNARTVAAEAKAKADAIYDANLGDKLKVEIKYLSNQLAAATARADAAEAEAQAASEANYTFSFDLMQAEAKVAAVDNYVSYVAQAWEHQAAAMSFEEWFTASRS